MTPEQKIKNEILIEAQKGRLYDNYIIDCEITAKNIDELYDQFIENNPDHEQDLLEEFRCSGIETTIGCANFSRYYECESVAKKLSDNSWVGWLYWHGGGKHGEPESIPWMNGAYNIQVTEKTVIAYDFKKI